MNISYLSALQRGPGDRKSDTAASIHMAAISDLLCHETMIPSLDMYSNGVCTVSNGRASVFSNTLTVPRSPQLIVEADMMLGTTPFNTQEEKERLVDEIFNRTVSRQMYFQQYKQRVAIISHSRWIFLKLLDAKLFERGFVEKHSTAVAFVILALVYKVHGTNLRTSFHTMTQVLNRLCISSNDTDSKTRFVYTAKFARLIERTILRALQYNINMLNTVPCRCRKWKQWRWCPCCR